VYDTPTALNMLESGEVDAFAGSLLVTSHYIQRGGHARLKVAGDLDFIYQPAFAARKDNKILIQILAKALAGIDDEEKNAIARKWTAVTYDQRIDYTKLYKYAAGTLALLGSSGIGTGAWPRKSAAAGPWRPPC
jgi:ABC-type amino acid transport substrate-binding protein